MSGTHGRGFVLLRRERGESDLYLEVLLDDGRLQRVVARGALRSSRRFSGGLIPFTLYRLLFGQTRNGATARLDEASIERAYPAVLSDLRRTAAAGAAAVLARELSGEVSLDAGLFDLYAELIEGLQSCDAQAAGAALVRFSLAAFESAGHGLMLDRCVRCDRAAPDNAMVSVNPLAGGTVCAGCGGGPVTLRASERRAIRAAGDGYADTFDRSLLSGVARMIEPRAPRGAQAVLGAMAHWT